MKNNNSLLKLCDFKRNVIDYIWISFFGIAIILASMFTGRIIDIDLAVFCNDETFLPIVLAIAGLVSGVRYSVNVLGMAYKKEIADFAYSLPISKTKYYLSKLSAVLIQVYITLCTIGIISGAFMIQSPYFIIQDIILAILGGMVTATLITGAMFFSLSVSGKGGTTFLFFTAIISFPMVFASTCNIAAVSAVHMGKVNLLTVPNLYTLTNTLYLQLKGNIIYYGMFRAWIFTLILGLAYAGIGLYMFIRRDAETTGSYHMKKWVNYVCMSVIPFIIIYKTTGYIFNNLYDHYSYKLISFQPSIAIALFGAALLISYLYALVTHGKSKRNIKCIFMSLALIIFSFAANYAIFESTYYPPKATIDKEDISHINIIMDKTSPFINTIYSEHITYGNYMAAKIDITDENIIADVSEIYNENNAKAKFTSYYKPLVKIHMNNGKAKFTSLQIDETIGNVPAYLGNDLLTAYYQIPTLNAVKNIMLDGMKLDNDQVASIYPIYLKEYNNLSYEEKIYHNNKVSDTINLTETIYPFSSINVYGKVGLYTTTDYLFITDKTPKTAKKAFELYNEKYGDATIKWLNSDNAPEYISVFIFKNGKFIGGGGTKAEEEYNYLADIINKYDMSAPSSSDNIAMLTYWSDKMYINSYGRIYITLSDEELETLAGYYKKDLP